MDSGANPVPVPPPIKLLSGYLYFGGTMTGFKTGTKLGGTNKKGPGLKIKGDATGGPFGMKKQTKAPKKRV
jgi:hypothetical protein